MRALGLVSIVIVLSLWTVGTVYVIVVMDMECTDLEERKDIHLDLVPPINCI